MRLPGVACYIDTMLTNIRALALELASLLRVR